MSFGRCLIPADNLNMVTDQSIEAAVLKAIFLASGRQVGSSVRVADISPITGIDPALVQVAVESLLETKCLCLGATADRVCVGVTGAAMIHDDIRQ